MLNVILNERKSMRIMTLLIIVALAGSVMGCFDNTRYGYHLDESARHAKALRKLEPAVLDSHVRYLEDVEPLIVDVTMHKESMLSRAKAKAKAWAMQYDNNAQR